MNVSSPPDQTVISFPKCCPIVLRQDTQQAGILQFKFKAILKQNSSSLLPSGKRIPSFDRKQMATILTGSWYCQKSRLIIFDSSELQLASCTVHIWRKL
jgi:hypothetical protein